MGSNEQVDVQTVREAVQQVIRDEAVTQNAIAKETGISSGTLSAWLTGEYKGRNDTVANKLVGWLNLRAEGTKARATMPVIPNWIETTTGGRIWGALSYAQIHGDMAVIYGGAGLGKTSTIREYQRCNPNVWVATASRSKGSIATILEAVALALGMDKVPLHPARLAREIEAAVAQKHGLLVIDEAQHLRIDALEEIRSIHDATGVGLALSGNASVYNRLSGNGRAQEEFSQLFSRVGRRLPIARPLAGDVEKLASVYGITAGAPLAALRDIGNKPGALRMVVKTCRIAVALSLGRPVGLQEIHAAWEELQAEPLATLEREAS